MSIRLETEKARKSLDRIVVRLTNHLTRPFTGGVGGTNGMPIEKRTIEAKSAIALAEEFTTTLERALAKIREEIEEADIRLSRITAKLQTSLAG